MKKLITLVTLLLLLILSSCFTYSKKPLSPVKDAVLDSSLLGMWQNDDDSWVHFGDVSHGITQMTMIDSDSGGTRIAKYLVHPTHTEVGSFLNTRQIGINETTGVVDTLDYFFLYYTYSRSKKRAEFFAIDLSDIIDSSLLISDTITVADEEVDRVVDEPSKMIKIIDSLVLDGDYESTLFEFISIQRVK